MLMRLNQPAGGNPFAAAGSKLSASNNSSSPFAKAAASTATAKPSVASAGTTSKSLISSKPSTTSSSTPATKPLYSQAAVDEPPTSLDSLFEEVRALFESPVFELGKVPDIPPPVELCG
ncbi:unnamed protein product [[Candida] boidinii]|nr:unnamed protein product [[Candida] boidinii]